jgi:hypothetical protein
MTANEPITLAQSLLNDVPPAGGGTRFSNQTYLTWLDEVSKEIMRDVRFPAARISTGTVPNLQEYQLPEVIEIWTVYVNGQIVVPSDLKVLEGHQTQNYDQGFLGGTNAQTPGSGGPTGTSGTYTPKWNVQPPAAYPITNNGCWPAPDAQQWSSSGMRPRYYNRGGYIGLVPAPSNPPPVVNGIPENNLVIDCIMTPDTIASLTDQLWYPQIYKRALAMGVVMFGKFSDDSQSTKESRNYAQQDYQAQVGKLRMWAAGFKGDAAEGPKMETNRRFYEWGGFKNALGYGSGYPD